MTTANPLKSNGSASNAIPLSIENMENEIQRLQSINNELVAALESIAAGDGDERRRAEEALARAESATPDYIPDAAKMVSATPAKHCEDCAPEFGCWDGGESCYKQPLQSSTPAKQSPAIDAESLIAACVPGGSICDPQAVADAIREYLRPQEPCGGQCGDPDCNLDTYGVTMRAPALHPDTACHKCGAQIMDPFTGMKQIHDVERCNGKAAHG